MFFIFQYNSFFQLLIVPHSKENHRTPNLKSKNQQKSAQSQRQPTRGRQDALFQTVLIIIVITLTPSIHGM